MKKTLLIALTLTLCFCVALPLAACGPGTSGTAAAEASGSADAGLAATRSYCIGCHTLPIPANVSPMTEEELTTFLADGHGGVTLGDETTSDIVAYLLP